MKKINSFAFWQYFITLLLYIYTIYTQMQVTAIYDQFLSLITTPPTKFGAFGLERTNYLASLVGNPQDDYPVIHIAGTSGK
jgi:hypothetical protein